MESRRVGTRKNTRSSTNKLNEFRELSATWIRGPRTLAWEELWRRILAEVDVGGKILIPDDALDHFLEEQHEAD